MFDNKLKKVAKILRDNHLTISTAESCTGGLLCSRLTDIAGSSEYMNESHVTYANEAKAKYLNVHTETLSKFGAVSQECAKEMAEGLQALSGCDIAVCTTGIAGPGGATEEKPVGLLYVSVKFQGKITVKEFKLKSNHNRKLMKFLFTQKAIFTVYDVLKKS